MMNGAFKRLPSEFGTFSVFMVYRYTPRDRLAGHAKHLEASGGVDWVYLSDQTLSWFPPSLWNPSITAAAGVLPDCESFADVFAQAGYIAAKAPGLGIMLSVDAVRYGPAELMRAALTLADLTEGRFTLMVGAGEVKQCKPFGWKRSEGLARLEDHLRLYRELWNATGPFDFQGNHWKFDKAWLGGARKYRPEIWTVGGGPKLFDFATSYADGLTSMVPGVWTSPEKAASAISEMKQQLRNKGRDPEAFGFGPIQMVLMHKDKSVIDRALDNPLVRFVAAIWGRLHMPDWREEGFEPPFPDDWHYAMRLLANKMSPSEVDDILSKVSRKMVEQSYIIGTPDEVAAQIQRYIDAGVTRVHPANLVNVALPLSEVAEAEEADIELMRRLKAANVRK